MIDPASAIAARTLAFNGIKKLFQLEKRFLNLVKICQLLARLSAILTILVQKQRPSFVEKGQS